MLMLGPSNDNMLTDWVQVSQGYDFPLVNYRSTDSKYTDKVCCPVWLNLPTGCFKKSVQVWIEILRELNMLKAKLFTI